MDASNQYAVILADPPWNWKAYSSAGEKRSANERIERLYPGPYLEMFSRTDRNGWDQWGDQVGRWTA
jgi:hypothetical protein